MSPCSKASYALSTFQTNVILSQNRSFRSCWICFCHTNFKRCMVNDRGSMRIWTPVTSFASHLKFARKASVFPPTTPFFPQLLLGFPGWHYSTYSRVNKCTFPSSIGTGTSSHVKIGYHTPRLITNYSSNSFFSRNGDLKTRMQSCAHAEINWLGLTQRYANSSSQTRLTEHFDEASIQPFLISLIDFITIW